MIPHLSSKHLPLLFYLLFSRSYESPISENLQWLEKLPPLQEDNKQPDSFEVQLKNILDEVEADHPDLAWT